MWYLAYQLPGSCLAMPHALHELSPGQRLQDTATTLRTFSAAAPGKMPATWLEQHIVAIPCVQPYGDLCSTRERDLLATQLVQRIEDLKTDAEGLMS